MTGECKTFMRAAKCSRVILSLCELYDLPLPKAADMFYRSETAGLIEEGVADLQCRSDKYLATLVWEEKVVGN